MQQERNRALYGWVEVDKRQQEHGRRECEDKRKGVKEFVENEEKRPREVKAAPKKRNLLALAFTLGSANIKKTCINLAALVSEKAKEKGWQVTVEAVQTLIRKTDFQQAYEDLKEEFDLTPGMLEDVKWGSDE